MRAGPAVACCGFLLALAICAGLSLTGAARLLPYDGETKDTDGGTAYLGYRVYRGGHSPRRARPSWGATRHPPAQR